MGAVAVARACFEAIHTCTVKPIFAALHVNAAVFNIARVIKQA
jgi:hypothetical protein